MAIAGFGPHNNDMVWHMSQKICGSWLIYLREDFQFQSDATQQPLDFTKEEIDRIAEAPATVSGWDFNSALGDTIMEKYEGLYVHLHELTNTVYRKVKKPCRFWLVVCPDVLSIFESATNGWCPNTRCVENKMWTASYLQGPPAPIQYKGTINRLWRIYSGPCAPKGKIILGCGGKDLSSEHYARTSVFNFLI